MSNNSKLDKKAAALASASVGKRAPALSLLPATTAVVVEGGSSEPPTPTDEKSKEGSQPSLKIAKRLVAASMGGGGKKGKGKVLPVRLVFSFSNTSGAASANAFAVTLTPGSATEFASLAALFDEYICDGGSAHIRGFVTTVAQTSGIDWAVMFDPADQTALASVNAALEAQVCFGPVALSGGAGNSGITGQPIATTPTGFIVFRWRTPKGPYLVGPNAGSNFIAGQWVSTATANAIFGALKFYVEAASAGTTVLSGHIVLNCRFRSRA